MPCFPYPHVQSFNFDRSIGQVTPKIHFFSLPKKILPGSKCPQNNLFDYENRSTAHGASATLHWQELYHPTLLFSGFFWLGAHGTKLERVTHVTVGDQYYLFFNSEIWSVLSALLPEHKPIDTKRFIFIIDCIKSHKE